MVSRPIVHMIWMFSSVTLQHSHTQKIVEIFCSHIYSSRNINDNPSQVLFIAENTNNKILKNVPSQCCCNGAFETPDTFLLVPRPSPPLLCNFTYKPRWNLGCTGRIWKPSLAGFKIIRWMYKLKFHFVNGSCFKCFCLHRLHSLQQTFCLCHLPKTF